MGDKELKENIEKIKQLLTLPDYDKIDAGIELAVSLEEPKIFETLLDGCSLESSRPKLNEWLKKTIIEESKLNEYPTGYYVLLALLLNAPIKSNIDESLKLNNISELVLKKCYLQTLPYGLSRLTQLKKLDISFNDSLSDSKSDLSKLNHLDLLLDHETLISAEAIANPRYKINDLINNTSAKENITVKYKVNVACIYRKK